MITSRTAVGYLRRSTTKQEASLDQQREVIERYAAQQGYSILRYYTDDGISGATGAHRPAFQEMVAKAENGRDFDTILVYDLSRFGRMDNDEAGYYRHRLRLVGANVVCIMEADRYSNPETAELLRPIEQTQHRAYLKKMSSDVLRGMKSAASKGHWIGGDAPYGYKRVLVGSEDRKPTDLVHGETVPRREGCHVELRPDPDEERWARWIFEQYGTTKKGFKQLACELNNHGVKTRAGKLWGHSSVKSVLENPAYVGDICYGRRSSGKFHRIDGQDGSARMKRQRDGVRRPCAVRITRNPQAQWVVHKNAHPPLVSQELWEKVKAKIHQHAQRTKGRVESSPYPLSGLVRCGHCGGLMWGKANRTRRDGRQYQTRYYRCGTYERQGKAGCQCYSIAVDPLEKFIRHTIQQRLVKLRSNDWYKSEIRQMLDEEPDGALQLQTLKNELRQVERQIETAMERFLTLDDEQMAAVAKKKLDDLSRKADALKRDIAEAASRAPRSVDDQIAIVMAEIDRLGSMLQLEDIGLRQQVYHQVIKSIVLYFAPAESGHVPFRFERGVIKMQEVAVPVGNAATSCWVGRGNWRSFEPSAPILAPFLAPFSGPPEPFMLSAVCLLRRSA